MKNLLYISPLPKDSQTGGANAVNYHIYKQLEKYFNCTYVQINPKESKLGKWCSQFLRKILRRPGRFYLFSVILAPPWGAMLRFFLIKMGVRQLSPSVFLVISVFLKNISA